MLSSLRSAVVALLLGIVVPGVAWSQSPSGARACGNGVIEVGEDCDGGACCTESCRYARATSSCDDADDCTEHDSCSNNGICIGIAKNCSRLGDSCRRGQCIDGKCTVVAANDEAACDDKNACTREDVCRHGRCTGEAVDCSALDGPCSIGACVDEGECLAVDINDGQACDDENACTSRDQCAGGTCAGTPTDCSRLDGICAIGVCAPDGSCVAQPDDGASCDDGDPCTGADTCSAGICAGTPTDCSHLNQGCVLGYCNADGVCDGHEVGEGETCDDGDACTTGDVCTESVCAGAALDCSTLDGACGRGRCDSATGCFTAPINEGAPCVDGDACTTDDTCRSGRCTGAPLDCSSLDGNCLVGVCRPDGSCAAAAVDDGIACDDGDACTTADTCNDAHCVGFPRDCSALDDACNVGTCGEDGECRPAARENGRKCNDGNACTIHDECLAGVCVGGAAASCDDGTVCTQDRCVPTRGCVFEPTGDDCLASCTIVEPCDAGPCQSPRHASVTIVDRDQGSAALLISAWMPYADAVPQPQATGLQIELSDETGRTVLALALPADAFEVSASSITLGMLERGVRKNHRTLRELELSFDDTAASVRLHAKVKGKAVAIPRDGDRLTLAVTFGARNETTCFQWPSLTCKLTLATWSATDSMASKRRYSCTATTAIEGD